MRKTIISKLLQIENEHNIKILYACESGSRAWGFESVDSDYDVRFIYTRSKDEYLSLESPKPEITLGIDADNLDIEGWDIRKSLLLLQKSNRALCEWAVSPMVYMDNGFRDDFVELSKKCFIPKVATNHYIGNIAKLVETLENDTKLKKLFYILRATYSAYFIAKNYSNPPMNFGELRVYVRFEKAIEDEINHLLQIKKSTTEKDMCKISDKLKLSILNSREELKGIAHSMPSKDKYGTKLLDEIFLRIIK